MEEMYPCDNGIELQAREGRRIRNTKCVNRKIYEQNQNNNTITIQ